LTNFLQKPVKTHKINAGLLKFENDLQKTAEYSRDNIFEFWHFSTFWNFVCDFERHCV